MCKVHWQSLKSSSLQWNLFPFKPFSCTWSDNDCDKSSDWTVIILNQSTIERRRCTWLSINSDQYISHQSPFQNYKTLQLHARNQKESFMCDMRVGGLISVVRGIYRRRNDVAMNSSIDPLLAKGFKSMFKRDHLRQSSISCGCYGCYMECIFCTNESD